MCSCVVVFLLSEPSRRQQSNDSKIFNVRHFFLQIPGGGAFMKPLELLRGSTKLLYRGGICKALGAVYTHMHIFAFSPTDTGVCFTKPLGALRGFMKPYTEGTSYTHTYTHMHNLVSIHRYVGCFLVALHRPFYGLPLILIKRNFAKN